MHGQKKQQQLVLVNVSSYVSLTELKTKSTTSQEKKIQLKVVKGDVAPLEHCSLAHLCYDVYIRLVLQ